MTGFFFFSDVVLKPFEGFILHLPSVEPWVKDSFQAFNMV